MIYSERLTSGLFATAITENTEGVNTFFAAFSVAKNNPFTVYKRLHKQRRFFHDHDSRDIYRAAADHD
jgi:hypothetical protein